MMIKRSIIHPMHFSTLENSYLGNRNANIAPSAVYLMSLKHDSNLHFLINKSNETISFRFFSDRIDLYLEFTSNSYIITDTLYRN